jgi:hypothetical protein
VIPSGCSPPVLALYPDAEHDPRTGCLRAHNELGRHHNALLQQSLEALRARHPDARITYADLFTPVMEMVESRASQLWAEGRRCCGGPGKNNFNGSVPCGDPPASLHRLYLAEKHGLLLHYPGGKGDERKEFCLSSRK